MSTRTRSFSPQTSKVLVALGARPQEWRHGYELGREVGLKSGSLYPILMRLSDARLLDSRWEQDPPAGRPARHLYRLSAMGLAAATQASKGARSRSKSDHRRRAASRIGSVPC